MGKENIDIETRIRNDNSIVVEHVHSINAVTKERGPNGLLGDNRGGLGTNPWLVLSQIMGPALNIPDEMAKYIGDPEEANFVIAPEYSTGSKRKG